MRSSKEGPERIASKRFSDGVSTLKRSPGHLSISDSTCHSMAESTDRNMSKSTRLHLSNARAHLLARARVLSFCIDPRPSAARAGRHLARSGRVVPRLGRSSRRCAARALGAEIPLPSALLFAIHADRISHAHAGMGHGKADGLTYGGVRQRATGNAILAGQRPESRNATSRGQCRHPSQGKPKGGSHVFSPNLRPFSPMFVVVRAVPLRAARAFLQQKVRFRHATPLGRRRTSKEPLLYSWARAAEMTPAVRCGCKGCGVCACWASTQSIRAFAN